MNEAILTIGGKEYVLKFTIGFWKRIKESCDIDQRNMETKLQENFGIVAPQIILESIVGDHKPELKEIESELDRSVLDIFEQAVINGMTKAEKEMLEIAKKQRAKTIEGIEKKIEDGSEKK